MKFLNYKENFLNDVFIYDDFFEYRAGFNYIDYDFYKNFIKNRKFNTKAKIGVINKIENISFVRNRNRDLLKQYASLSQKNGKTISLFKNINLSSENLFYILSTESEEFKKYKNYENYVYLYENVNFYSNINNILYFSIKDLESIFEIRTIKNGKRIKSPNKYSHEIIYIPPKKRFKYILRALSIYKEHFKNYNLWERIFWSFLLTILNKNNSFLRKRRDYIYSKSIKFFKKKKTK